MAGVQTEALPRGEQVFLEKGRNPGFTRGMERSPSPEARELEASKTTAFMLRFSNNCRKVTELHQWPPCHHSERNQLGCFHWSNVLETP